MREQRRLPIGAEALGGEVHFRAWAPDHRRAAVVLESGRHAGEHSLSGEPGGYFSGLVAGAAPGDLYRYRLDGGAPLPDPASRFQPRGPRGPSRVVDPAAFAWTDGNWKGVSL